MKASVNRELKYFANDFVGIRRQLKSFGAELVEKTKQADTFYKTSNRDYLLKLRKENGKLEVVYYYSTQNAGQRNVSFRVWPIKDEIVKDMMDAILPTVGNVDKRREVWTKGRLVFHLDTVKSVGRVFEIESRNGNKDQLEKLRKLFLPYLGKQIVGSNIDLVGKTKVAP